ncbi:gag-pol polyprotein [Cucumis melo var. makuwa]|uniref:Gag-pol polyprotein n=1 Tax=Cucumis melo var. makuwa TaxID=1194695 RepID=A0A5D3B8V3_CUCMM|nr:gag-pol polyprotein [Cucumis melo var. makuwa]TYJ96280.1 gag-pol polyprotein [Cucumis melo var. makuwa]
MLTNGTKKIDDLIGQRKRCDDKRGLGFSERKSAINENKTVFVRESDRYDNQTAKGKWTKDTTSPGNTSFFSELSECNIGSVMFGDREKGRIIGKGTINHPGLPYLLDVRLVQGLSANLISIGQLSDQGWKANQLHKSTTQPTTTSTLELLHIDLMGPMQTESLGEKEALNTACYIHNRVTLRPGTTSTSYELWKGRKLNIEEYFWVTPPTVAPIESTISAPEQLWNPLMFVDDYGKASKSSLDKEHELFWVPYSQKIRPSGSEYSSLTEDSSPSRPSENSVIVPVAITSADHLEAGSKEVYIAQPEGFIDLVHRDHVYKLCKALYCLKQASRAWYERLSTYLLQQGYQREGADQTMFTYRQGAEFLIVQIYVDDIIFGGFQIRQGATSIFFSQEKYAKNLILKFGMNKAKPKRTPVVAHLKMTKDTTGEKVDSIT